MHIERKSILEIDFILNIDGKVIAIEVKSRKNKQAKFLKLIIQNYKTTTKNLHKLLTDLKLHDKIK